MDTQAAKQQLEATLEELNRAEQELTGEQDPGDRPDTSELDQGDAAVQLTSIDRETASLEVIAQQRERVEAALARIADGSYGKCVDCGREIPAERLEARPEVARCLDDQRKAEAAGAVS